MKILLLILISLPGLSLAHCPIEIEAHGESFCANLQWKNGERKIQGQFIDSGELSPQLVKMGEIPQKWIYSNGEILVWKKGDVAHLPQKINGFRVFPYMHMESGHHHSASYSFVWDDSLKLYKIQAVAFQEMPGCWSFRWTTAIDDSLKKSQWLMNILSYDNLTDDGNIEMASFCSDIKTGGDHNHHMDH